MFLEIYGQKRKFPWWKIWLAMATIMLAAAVPLSFEMFVDRSPHMINDPIPNSNICWRMVWPAVPKNKYATFKTLSATVTAYSSEESPGINAKGYSPIKGISIACPRNVRFGSRVYFPRLRLTRYCDDRTALQYDGRFDLYVGSKREAIAWGKRTEVIQIYQ